MQDEPNYLPTDPAEIEKLQLEEMDRLNQPEQPEAVDEVPQDIDSIRGAMIQEELTSFLTNFEKRHNVKLGLSINIKAIAPQPVQTTEVHNGPAPDISELPQE